MDFYSRDRGYDPFEDYDDSSDDGVNNGSSSEDEIDIILHGTPEQRRKLQQAHNKKTKNKLSYKMENMKNDSSSEDDFEKEMNAELNRHVKSLEAARAPGKLTIEEVTKAESSGSKTAPVDVNASSEKAGSSEDKNGSSQQEYYDEMYFDSDEEDVAAESNATQSSTTRKKKHAVISNDDLLYDPDMDDEDQKWVDRQRQSHRSHTGKTGKTKGKMPNSDALLDCPACMTTLCLDCQRHETYKHQYRAMFVMNCVIDKSEQLQCPEQAPKRKKKFEFGFTALQHDNGYIAPRKKKKKNKEPQVEAMETAMNSSQKDLFNPVRCAECNTVVGVIDDDEVYHFFNILASHT